MTLRFATSDKFLSLILCANFCIYAFFYVFISQTLSPEFRESANIISWCATPTFIFLCFLLYKFPECVSKADKIFYIFALILFPYVILPLFVLFVMVASAIFNPEKLYRLLELDIRAAFAKTAFTFIFLTFTASIWNACALLVVFADFAFGSLAKLRATKSAKKYRLVFWASFALFFLTALFVIFANYKVLQFYTLFFIAAFSIYKLAAFVVCKRRIGKNFSAYP